MEGHGSLVERVCAIADSATASYEALAPEEIGFRFGAHAGRGVVLQRDTALELGANNLSSGMIIPTTCLNRVVDGHVAVCGKEIDELIACREADESLQVPFGMAILVAGSDVSSADFSTLEDCLYAKDYVDGYFARSSEGRIYSRVSRRLADAGFSLRGLGSALVLMVKEACPAAERVEVVFVTEAGEAFDEFVALRSEWLSFAHDTRKGVWLEKGLDIDCPAGGHCGQCADRDLCNSVRKIANMRKRGE